MPAKPKKEAPKDEKPIKKSSWIADLDPIACFGDLLSGDIFEVAKPIPDGGNTVKADDTVTGDDNGSGEDKRAPITINNIFRNPSKPKRTERTASEEEGKTAGKQKQGSDDTKAE